jgi:multiple sugar transport system permease protein
MWSLRVFGVIYVLTNGGPANGTTTLNWYAYEQTFSFLKFGTGASIAIVIAAITLLATSLYMVILFRPQRHAR